MPCFSCSRVNQTENYHQPNGPILQASLINNYRFNESLTFPWEINFLFIYKKYKKLKICANLCCFIFTSEFFHLFYGFDKLYANITALAPDSDNMDGIFSSKHTKAPVFLVRAFIYYLHHGNIFFTINQSINQPRIMYFRRRHLQANSQGFLLFCTIWAHITWYIFLAKRPRLKQLRKLRKKQQMLYRFTIFMSSDWFNYWVHRNPKYFVNLICFFFVLV